MKTSSIVKLLFLPALCLIVLSAQPAQSQVIKKSQGYLFRMKFVAGQGIKFRIPTKVIGAESHPLNLNFSANLQVKKVRNGIATIEGSIQSPLGAGGSNDRKSSEDVNGRGQVVGADDGTGLWVVYPESPMKVGQSFSGKLPPEVMKSTGQTGSDQATYVFKGFKNVGKTRCARLEFKSDGSTGPRGSILVSTKDGIPERIYERFGLNLGHGNSKITVILNYLRQN